MLIYKINQILRGNPKKDDFVSLVEMLDSDLYSEEPKRFVVERGQAGNFIVDRRRAFFSQAVIYMVYERKVLAGSDEEILASDRSGYRIIRSKDRLKVYSFSDRSLLEDLVQVRTKKERIY